ncbi:DUF4150 domain-containing protein [Mesorhizobium caraganae]|uniref:DUF4150 domain-containing protein n=1 Tax=Mesorhizobium caraganae TaxID=483206 RepID=UPI00178446D8|nr:DUF4150 domain-containing protein [Mesorhizobium caraganae]MBM2714687.1 DUF4150 domain-containing protein [Mesorhizobium caraganae]
MSVTVKINGTMQGIVHKGSSDFAMSTAPDVCKTPSPGGPVPIPYPVIISNASDLANGTTTVKVDGNSCAIKGSELSRCSGDEAGTAGGVVSSTNMKEATWITYSFDVKMDGSNVCRFSDKLKMNHGNTICMAGIIPDVCKAGSNPLIIKCSDYKEERNKEKRECDIKCMCAKCLEMNKQGDFRRQASHAPRSGGRKSLRKLGNAGANAYRKALTDQLPPKGTAKPDDIKDNFVHKCAHDRWKDQGAKPKLPGMSPDHMKEIQVGGATKDFANLRMMPSKPNEWIGSKMKGFKTTDFTYANGKKVKAHTGVTLDCCK